MGDQFRGLERLSLGTLILAVLFSSGCSMAQHHSSSPKPARSPSSQVLIWPVTSHKITQDFRSGNFDPHDGIDIAAPKGSRVYAPADGHVTYAGKKFQGYGKMIILEHTSHLSTIFGHCQKLLVKEGEFVKRGGLIALVGRSGKATGPHLHFEVRLNKEPVNPKVFLK